MPQVINTNIASLNAQRNLNTSQTSLATALQRLSSGLRINSAKDDAAGLGIADRFSSQIRGLNQAVRNANDGISLAQTAEGALGSVIDNLQRMRELAVQSSNASNTTIDRNAIQSEVDQLIAEIDRVGSTTSFNGVKLLDGSFTAQAFQVGANANQTISVSVGSARIDKLGGGIQAAVSGTGNSTELKNGDLVLNGVVVGGSIASTDTASYSNASASAIAKVAAINAVKDSTGVGAVVNDNVNAGASMSIASSGFAGIVITLNGTALSAITLSTSDTSTSRATIVQAINAKKDQTGITAVDTGDDKSGIKLVSADGRNITMSVASSGAVAGASAMAGNLGISSISTTASTTYGSYTLTATKDITVETTLTGNLDHAGLRSGTYKSQTAYVASNDGLSTQTATDLLSGDVKINGVLIGGASATSDKASYTNASASAIAKATAINAASKDSGVTATVNANSAYGGTTTLASTSGLSLSLTINGVSIAAVSLATTSNSDNRTAVVNAINLKSGQTGVTAVDTGDDTRGIQLVAADGRNITVASQASTIGIDAAGLRSLATTGAAVTTYGTYTLVSAKEFSVDLGTSGNGTSGLAVDVASYGKGKSGMALQSVDLSTADGATAALAAIDNALATVNSLRGDLGAVQNRFNTTVANLQTNAENLTASKSRITDADFAAETANLTRSQILQQAGVAMLAQANALPNQVLTLLRG